MSSLYIGMDISMNSTGICFIYNSKNLYLNILNRNVISKNQKLTDEDIISNNEILSLLHKTNNVILKIIDRKSVSKPKKIGLSEWGRRCMKNNMEYSDIVVSYMIDIISEYNVDSKDIIICIENYSYSSYTDNLIQMVELTYPIKEKIITRISPDYSNIHLITSPEIKKNLGNGNFDKYDMLMSYTKNILCDDTLKDDDFYGIIKNNIQLITKERKKKEKIIKEVITPISDIIDSYFIAKWEKDKNN